jgi:hypothetical protein
MTKQQFVLGIAIISLFVSLYNLLYPPIIVSTANVKIVKIEKVKVITDIDGNVEVNVKGEENENIIR